MLCYALLCLFCKTRSTTLVFSCSFSTNNCNNFSSVCVLPAGEWIFMRSMQEPIGLDYVWNRIQMIEIMPPVLCAPSRRAAEINTAPAASSNVCFRRNQSGPTQRRWRPVDDVTFADDNNVVERLKRDARGVRCAPVNTLRWPNEISRALDCIMNEQAN